MSLPERVTLAYGLFWAEDYWGPSDSGIAFYLTLTA